MEVGTLQLNERETTAGPDAAVVCSKSANALPHCLLPHTLDGRASHNGAEKVDGARSDLGGLRNTGVASGLLLARLSSVNI